jgi:hypothetical protein
LASTSSFFFFPFVSSAFSLASSSSQGEEDVLLVHPQNGLKGLILNWCIGGCWFTPAIFGDLHKQPF